MKGKERCEERDGKLDNEIEKSGRCLENVDDLHGTRIRNVAVMIFSWLLYVCEGKTKGC